MDHSKYFKTVKYNPLSSSTVTDDAEKKRIQPYIDNLDIAMKDSTVRNIAIFGKFGAGKSTVINTFLKEKEDHVTSYAKSISGCYHGLKDHISSVCGKLQSDEIRPLKLSTATFTRTNETSENNEWVDVERNLVQQMLYRPRNKDLPNSKFRKIESSSRIKWISFSTLLSIILISTSLLTGWGNLLRSFFSGETLTDVKVLLFLVSAFLFAFLLVMVAWYLPPLFSSAKLFLGKNELLISDGRSAFNEYLDEIIYFFSRTKYNLVIFEDIDRADDLNIFEHLRELNQILNSNRTIQEKYQVDTDVPAIKFLYAVKEDLFDNQMLSNHDNKLQTSLDEDIPDNPVSNEVLQDRDSIISEATTKFFDWTLTVLPRVSAANASEFLMGSFVNPTDEFKNYLRGVGGYFEDIRTLENSINDLKLYMNLRPGSGLDVEKLFTILLFKNNYPTQYQKFLRHEGSISKILRGRALAEKYIQGLREKLSKLQLQQKQLSTSTEQCVVDRYLSIFLKAGAQPGSRVSDSGGQVIISPLIKMDFTQLRELYLRVTQNDSEVKWGQYGKSIPSQDLTIVEDNFNSESVFKGTSLTETIHNVSEKIMAIQDKITHIQSESLTEIAKSNPSDVSDMLSDAGEARDFVSFSIVSGYLDETTDDYLTFFTGERISKPDREVVLAIRSGRIVPFSRSIENVANFVAELIDSDYSMASMALRDIIYSGLLEDPIFSTQGLETAYNAAIRQLSLQEENMFSENLDKILNLEAPAKKMNFFVQQLAFNLKNNWGKYQGKQVHILAPIILYSTKAEDMPEVLSLSPWLINYLNENQWEDAISCFSEQPERATSIYSFDQVIVNQLNPSTQSIHEFIEFLINNQALSCLPETVPTLLAAYQGETTQPLSYDIALEPKNDSLKAYVDQNSEQFLISEIKLDLIKNESKSSMTKLIQLAGLQSRTRQEALQKYPRSDLSLKLINNNEIDGDGFPNLVEEIVMNEKAENDWENLTYLTSLKNGDKKFKSVAQFIEQTHDFAELTPASNDEEREILTNVVNTHTIVASEQNKAVLTSSSNYSGPSQNEATRNQLIKWKVVKLEKELLESNLEQEQLIELSDQYLSDEYDAWSDLEKMLFQKLSIEVLVKIVLNPNGALSKLRKIAFNELRDNQLSNTELTDEQKRQIVNALFTSNFSFGEETDVLSLYEAITEENIKLSLLNELCSKPEIATDKVILNLIQLTSNLDINQIVNSDHKRLKFHNRTEIKTLLEALNARKITGKLTFSKSGKWVSVSQLTKLTSLLSTGF